MRAANSRVLLARRIVVAGFLAIALIIFLLMWWLPSLIFGGIQAWQILAVPLALLVASRIAMWLWFSNRNYTCRHLLLLIACGVAIALWIGANLWYCAVEIPDVGEPFDLKAFDAELRQAANSKANDFECVRGLVGPGFSTRCRRPKVGLAAKQSPVSS